MYHANQQRKMHQPGISQNESEARAKLAQYVYEYLCQNGAPKSAEMFKSETQTLSELPQINLSGEGPGFLYAWWSVFWDLYSATPDRRDKADPTLEAKAYFEMFHGYGMNGQVSGQRMPTDLSMRYSNLQFSSGPPPPMNVPPHGMDPTMMGNFYRPQQSNVGPSSQSSPIPGYQNSFAGPPRFSHPMAPRPGMPPQIGHNGFVGAPGGYPSNDPRMMVPNRMVANPRSLSFPTNMRPVRPGIYGPQFMDSPTTPTFPSQGPMMQNGIMMGSMPPSNPNYDPQMMMHSNPNMNPQFSMMCDPSGSGTPTSSADPTNGPPHSVPPPNNIGNPSSVGSGHGNMPASVPTENPHDLKQSPNSVQPGVTINGGTPAQQHGPGSQNTGPGSAPGIAGGPSSVHSQTGAPNSVNTNISNPQHHSTPQSHAAQLTPTSGAPENVLIDYQQNVDNPSGEHDKGKEEEISKIKASLIEGFGDKSTYTYTT